MAHTTMTCDEFGLHVGQYVRGALPDPLRQGCELHLAGCGHCQSDLATLATTGEHLTCDELVQQVPAYQEGTLSLSEWSHFVAHLETCPACWAHFVESGELGPPSGGAGATEVGS